MPIIHRTNNRVMPANHGSVGVARNAIADLIPVQRARVHNAFAVENYSGVLYHMLTCGTRCHCRSVQRAASTRLNEDGSARPGFLSEMLLGEEFGISPHGQRRPDYVDLSPPPVQSTAARPAVFKETEGTIGFSIDQEAFEETMYGQRSAPALRDSDSRSAPLLPTGPSQFAENDVFTSDPSKAAGTTVIDSGVGAHGPVEDADWEQVPFAVDYGLVDATTSACPICMGTGYVGGYSVLNGARIVLNYQHPEADFGASALDLDGTIPRITGRYASFDIRLPAHVIDVDALRVWNGLKVIKASMSVDDIALTHPDSLRRFCDGRAHTLRVDFDEDTTFSHVEIQLYQSNEEAYWSLPEVTKTSARELLDSTDNFQVVFSPMVPLIRPGDVLADASHGKILYVESVTGKTEKSRAVLGWTSQVRVVQPQEILTLLPRRRRKEQLNSPALPRQNR